MLVQNNNIDNKVKKCKKCGCIKENNMFSRRENGTKILPICKQCISKKILDYRRTKIGLLKKIYLAQKRRNHVSYSLEYFLDRYLNNSLFIRLYENWVESNYNVKIIPSIDRINNNLPYIETNIQMVTWTQNKLNADKHMRLGKIIHAVRPHVKVNQFNKDNIIVKTYPSISQAERETGIFKESISQVCSGKRKTAGGYIWRKLDV